MAGFDNGVPRIGRRRLIGAAVAGGALPLVHVRTAGAAGKLAVAFTDSFIPVNNHVVRRQVADWAEKNKVDVQVDLISTVGNKLTVVGAAEAQAKSGHDIFTFASWDLYNTRDSLAPVDDVVEALSRDYGVIDATAEYQAKVDGQWKGLANSWAQVKPPCARLSWFRQHGLDLQAMYPARAEHTSLQDAWTYDLFLKYAELAAKDGMAFALGFGGPGNTDATDQWGAVFHAFGADLVDRDGTVKLGTPEMLACLEYAQKLVKFLPDEAASYDDASNNRALVSGKTALVFNAPSAWWVARRDAPAIAQDCWTFPAPAGPRGRFQPIQNFYWGIWSFSRNQSAARELMLHLMQKQLVEERIVAVEGYNVPPFSGMRDFTVWETAGPPPGTLFNYPIRPWHGSRPSLPASEANPNVAAQIYANGIHNGMIARLKSGRSIKEVTAWAQDQLESLTR
jgi:ABC-type glycerol-3-phosphate transport system substrate-binding protein